MLELNKWFFVLSANFLILLWVLNKLLFQPLLHMLQERTDTINNSLAAAKEMTQKKDAEARELNKELAEARGKAKDIFESLRLEAINKQKDVFSKAEGDASEILKKARQELKAEAEKARQSLRSDIDRFSDDIVRKLLRA